MAKKLLLTVFIASFLLGVAYTVNAQMVVTHRAPESDDDIRHLYGKELIQLLLEKTEDQFGEYDLQASPPMNFTRTYEELYDGEIENFVIQDAARDEHLEQLDYVPIPVARGIFGYRVFFTSPQIAEELEKVQNLEELTDYSIGQGSDWLDVEILRDIGFEVVEVPNFGSLFRMVAANRFDLFSRGVNEILPEYEVYNDLVDNLAVDDNVVLYYPMPRFLFTSPGNDELMERLEAGLEIAMEDGSFMNHWENHFQESVEFSNLEDRRIIRADNPFVETLNIEELEPYIYDPLAE